MWSVPRRSRARVTASATPSALAGPGSGTHLVRNWTSSRRAASAPAINSGRAVVVSHVEGGEPGVGVGVHGA